MMSNHNGIKHILLFMFVFTTAFVSYPAFSENWIALMRVNGIEKDTEAEISVDADSIRTVDGLVRYWRKEAHIDSNGRQRLVIKRAYAVNCIDDTAAETSSIITHETDTIGPTTKQRHEWVFKENSPGSVGHNMTTNVCAWSEGARFYTYPNWIVFNKVADYYYIDLNSLRNVDGYTYFWSKLSKPGKVTMLLYTSLDCANESSALIGVGEEAELIKLHRKRSHQYLPLKGEKDKYQYDYICSFGSKITLGNENPTKPSTRQYSGSGFVINGAGYVITNHHVTRECKSFDILHGTSNYPAQLIKSDLNLDLALLRIKADLSPPKVRQSPLDVGESVYVAGFPLPGLLSNDLNLTSGTVSSTAGLANDLTRLQVTAPVQPGNSGGPLIDENGYIAGIVVSKLNAVKMASTTGDIPQNVNFAIKADVLRLFLDANRVKYISANSSNSLSSVQIGKKARDYTVQVLCR